MIKVIKTDYKIDDYTVFKVISDEEYLINSVILDKEMTSNDYKIPLASVVEEILIRDFNSKNFDNIDKYLYNSKNTPVYDPSYRKFLEKEREIKLNNLLENEI
jgi:hypothetical protein